MNKAMCLMCVLATCAAATAQTLVFTNGVNGVVVRDGHVRDSRPNENYGGSGSLQTWPGRKAFFIVDSFFGNAPHQVPLNSSILSAKLHMWLHYNAGRADDQNVRVYVAIADMRDHIGASDGAAQAGEMTWTRKSWPDLGWGDDGTGVEGPVALEDYERDIFVDNLITPLVERGPTGEWWDLDITPIVQAWQAYENDPEAEGAYPNNGVMLAGRYVGEVDPLAPAQLSFHSSDLAFEEHHPPELHVEIEPGPDCSPGDADGDGDVDDDDLSLLLANWGADTDCAHGEFSDNPPVNDDDLSLLLANWTGALPAAVPEPMVTAMLMAAVALLKLRHRG